jgi:hypothetical protein
LTFIRDGRAPQALFDSLVELLDSPLVSDDELPDEDEDVAGCGEDVVEAAEDAAADALADADAAADEAACEVA